MMAISWRTSVGAAWLLISVAAAIEYDGMTSGDMNLMYQDHNYLEPGPQPSMMEKEDILRNILFPKVFDPYQDMSPNSLAGPKWLSSGTVLVPFQDTIDLTKGPMMKRISNVDGIRVRSRPAKPALQKWKIKKGKVGSQLICYFKLCAFRSPL